MVWYFCGSIIDVERQNPDTHQPAADQVHYPKQKQENWNISAILVFISKYIRIYSTDILYHQIYWCWYLQMMILESTRLWKIHLLICALALKESKADSHQFRIGNPCLPLGHNTSFFISSKVNTARSNGIIFATCGRNITLSCKQIASLSCSKLLQSLLHLICC